MPSDSAQVPRLLHIANGTSTTATIEAAHIPGACCIWADPLHEGPVPGGISDDELVTVRARHLASTSRGSVTEEDVAQELRRWRAVIDDVDGYDELILWYEHDLFDQLNLIQALGHVRIRAAGQKPVTLVSIGSFPGRVRFKGLGELTPNELATLLDIRQPVTDDQYTLADRAWAAFRAPDPRELEALLGKDTSALPFLAPALGRHLREYPWTADGLSATERRLLELARASPIEIWSAFPRMHDEETSFFIADGSFWSIVVDLGSGARPLIDVNVVSDGTDLPRGTIALTPLGRDVLDRRVDRVQEAGLDRWFGGVHLAGSGPTWRWDDEQKRIARG
jgi:hypothetical protein